MENDKKNNNVKTSDNAASKSAEPSMQRKTEQDRADEILRAAQEKEKKKKKRSAELDKIDAGPVAFVRGTAKELRAATWPTAGDLLKWCLIVIATVAIVATFAMLSDNFVATPLMYFISEFQFDTDTFDWKDIALVILTFITGIGSIAGVYLHQGGETEGLSDTLATKLTGGSGQAQKNLDKLTLVCIVAFVLCLIAMMLIYPQGTLATA